MTNLYVGVLVALLAGVQFAIPAIAQDKPENEVKEICEAKQKGAKKEEYFSEYPSQEEVEQASGEKKSELQALLSDKVRALKIWDNCGK
jgi:hypothetical protein